MKVTAERRGGPGSLWAGLGGPTDVPEGETPRDCCDLTAPPDRALEVEAFTVDAPGTLGIIQLFDGAWQSPGDFSEDFDSTPTNGSTLLAFLFDPAGATIDTTGWTLLESAVTTSSDAVSLDVWTKVAGVAEPTTVHVDTTGAAIKFRRMILYEVGGSVDVSDHLDDQSNASPLTGAPLTPAVDPGILLAAFTGQVATYVGDPTWTPLGALVTDSFSRHPADRPVTWVGHQSTTTGTYTPSLTTTPLYAGRNTCSVDVILGATPTLPSWDVPAPNTVDGDDATYHEIEGPDVLRVDLGDPFHIVRARLLIGCETAHSVTYRVAGANEADFSDIVNLGHVTFDSTGSFTPDDVEITWTTIESYRYFQLSGTDETRRIYSFELYEPSVALGEDHSHDAIEAEIADLAAAIDDVGTNFVSKTDGGLETVDAHGAAGATETLDLGSGNWHSLTLDADCTITVTGFTVAAGCSALVKVTQDGTGGHAITWDADVVFAAGADDQPAQGAGDVSWFVLASDEGDSVIYGFPVGGSAAPTYATPAIVLGTVAADGAADSVIRSDATIVAFDVTVPETQAFSDAAATGSAAVAARRDHKHGMPAASGTSATDANIWRPLMDGAGAVITDGTGQAVMAYGPA